MNKSQILILCLFLALVSCAPGVFLGLGHLAADPEVTPPQVLSFKEMGTIIINWQEDPRAEEYILYRKPDNLVSEYSIIYRGTELKYVDTDCEDEERFLYALSKIRGVKEFGPSTGIFGVCSDTKEDELENNNTPENATWLEYDREGSLYYYRDRAGNVLSDVDWFYLDIDPRKFANIIIKEGDLLEGETSFYFCKDAEVPKRVTQSLGIPIYNYSYQKARFYFKISPEVNSFISDLKEGGGTFKEYTVSLHSINQIGGGNR